MTARHYRIGKDVHAWGEREVFRDELLADGALVRIMNPVLYQRALRAARHALRHAEPFQTIETAVRAGAAAPPQTAEPTRVVERPTVAEPPDAPESRAAAEPPRTAEPAETAEPLPAQPQPVSNDLEQHPVEHREESSRDGQPEPRL